MSKKKKPDDALAFLTLEQFFSNAIEAAKHSEAQTAEVGKFLAAIMAELGTLTADLTKQMEDTLAALEKELFDKAPGEITAEALRLRGMAEAYKHVADQMATMVKRLEERDEETVH